MAKNKNKDKRQPNIVVFLVEGESDRIALEIPLANIISEMHPDYNVKFLLQHKFVNKEGLEFDCEDENDIDSDFIAEDEYEIGGDITSSPFVTPEKIELKITNRFIKPAEIAEGLYPKRIAKVIQIVDLDGTYISNERVVGFTSGREDNNKPYYNTKDAVIETDNIDGIIARNERKRHNLDYLLSLSTQGIKIKTKTIPYEIYYFSSNLDHFISNDANVERGKKQLADKFLRKHGLDVDAFSKFFFEDSGSIGKLGYYESWDMIKEGNNSLGRFTNIDCLIQKLINDGV